MERRCDCISKNMIRTSRRLGFMISWCLILPLFLRTSVCLQVTLEEDLAKVPTTRLAENNGAKMFSGRGGEEHFNGQVVISENYILVGARNILYNISLSSLQEFKRFDWSSSGDVVAFCKNRDVPKDKCHNYIKVVLEKSGPSSSSSSSKEFLICGTNSFKPTCRTLAQEQGSGEYQLMKENDGRAISPGDPSLNSTAIHYDDKIFSATVFSRESLIFSSPLRTQQQNSLLLNDPNFVGSMSYEGLVYFFFRETAIENINCGKVVFSRVARLCPNDKGGKWIMKNMWTTFFKARLNCSLPGEFPFYFDEIQSISGVGQGSVHSTLTNESSQIMYAVFNTPRNSLRGSAICAFKMSDVLKSFTGKFKERKNDYSSWLTATNVPEPHPAATCPNDSLTLSDQTLNFIKSHPLMDRAVPALGGKPAFVQSSFKYSLTQVAVDWRMLAADERYYDVIFSGTDDGRILKTFNAGKGSDVSPRLVEVLVMPSTQPIIGLKIFTDPEDKQKKLLIITKEEIFSAPLHRCSAAKTCRSCVALKDPYCSWTANKCSHSQVGLQSLETGRHSKCPYELDESEAKPSCQFCQCVIPNKLEILDKIPSRDPETTTPFSVTTNSYDFEGFATFEHLVYPGTCINNEDTCAQSTRNQVAIAVILSMIASLVLGFLVGVCFTQRRKVYAYGLTRITSLRNQVLKKEFNDDAQTKSENYYETGPPSSASSHRPIIPSQYWIKNKSYPQGGSDLMQRRTLPSNSSSFTFMSPTLTSNDDPPTPPSIAKLPLKLNIFNFMKDGTPPSDINVLPNGLSSPDENLELSKAEAEDIFPFIDGVQENMESTFHNTFDVTPTTPAVSREVSFANSEDTKADVRPKKSFVQQIRKNGFLTNSISKVRSFLGSGSEVHL